MTSARSKSISLKSISPSIYHLIYSFLAKELWFQDIHPSAVTDHFSFSNNFCSYFKIRHRDCRKYCSNPTFTEVFYTKICTFVRTFCSLNFMSNLHGFKKVIVFFVYFAYCLKKVVKCVFETVWNFSSYWICIKSSPVHL